MGQTGHERSHEQAHATCATILLCARLERCTSGAQRPLCLGPEECASVCEHMWVYPFPRERPQGIQTLWVPVAQESALFSRGRVRGSWEGSPQDLWKIMVTLTLWGAQTWLTAGVPPSNNCRAFLHSHLSLHWWSFLKPPQCHKSCWELLSALSSRQQATEQGFPCPLQQEAPEAAPGAARCPQIGSRYLVKPCGAGWVRAVRQTPRAPAPSPPAPPLTEGRPLGP